MTYWREFSVNACAAFARGMPHDDDVIRAGIGRKLADEIDRLRGLLTRCVDPIVDNLNDVKNERAKYAGYATRQSRYDGPIEELRTLKSDVEAALAEPWLVPNLVTGEIVLVKPSPPLGQGVEGTPGGGANRQHIPGENCPLCKNDPPDPDPIF